MARRIIIVLGLLALVACTGSLRRRAPVARGPAIPLTQDARDLAVSEMRFAIDLHRALALEDGNIFVSPHSIAEVVSMAAVAARGDTEVALRSTLRLDMASSRLPEAYRSLDDALTRVTDAGRSSRLSPTLSIGNALWADQRYAFKPAYVSLLQDGFSAVAKNADFASRAAEAASEINAWVAGLTENRIRELVKVADLRPDAGLMLLNAVFFRAPWQEAFDANNTRPREFTLQDGRQARVPMMMETMDLRYLEGDGWQLVEMPYVGVDASMVILLPRPGRLGEVEGALDATALGTWIESASSQSVRIHLPRIKMTKRVRLGEVLRRMGAGVAFESTADFTGATDFKPCYVDDVVHQAVLDVDEEGTVAAAATALSAPCCPVGSTEPVAFIVDRPFLLLLRNTATGAPLFFGRIADPGTRMPE